MRNNYDLSAHQGGRVHNCGLCGKQWYESLIRACPERGGRRVCAYCCRLCPQSYRDGTIQGCRASDVARAAKKRRGRHSPPHRPVVFRVQALGTEKSKPGTFQEPYKALQLFACACVRDFGLVRYPIFR